jgi:hypothetical protein
LPIIDLLRTVEWPIPFELHNEDYDESRKLASVFYGTGLNRDGCILARNTRSLKPADCIFQLAWFANQFATNAPGQEASRVSLYPSVTAVLVAVSPAKRVGKAFQKNQGCESG